MAQLLTFLDVSNCKSLNGRFFRIIELTIGPTLPKIAIDSMGKSIEDEVRLTLKNDNEYKKYKKGDLLVGITVSFDMDWNKCSSSNRYDSLSGQGLMIE